ncbi:hypothetical protein LCGC14_1655040 [marine sediment metagenome]|uniref:Uncharacterized protein n=1 Tax=marine sediment metagenome TaxID=412755 RepID=A0A0F9HVQ4_9ZZZZ
MGRRAITPEKVINECLRRNVSKLPQVLDALLASAIKTQKVTCPHCDTKFHAPGGGDVKAQIYFTDRIMGKPKESISHEMKQPSVTGDDLLRFSAAIMKDQLGRLAETALLGEYEVIEDVDVDSESSNGDVSDGEGGTRPATDGGGESIGSVESETSSSEEE